MSAQQPHAPRQVYEFGDFRLDPALNTLRSIADDQPITLTPRVYETLLYLVENCGQVLDKARLLKAIWTHTVVEENNLNQHISVLRRVLRDGEKGARYVLTVPRRGYKFIAEVRTVLAAPTENRAAPMSVAVLPFTNLSGSAEREYFAEGMAEELIQRLLKIPGIKVPSRTSSFVYRQRQLDARQIAADLKVATLLEGSVSGLGEHVRINLQLSDGTTGYQIWNGSFDRPFRDLFQLQSEMAASIAETLKQHLGVDLAAAGIMKSPCNDLQAYDLYLQASSLMLLPPADYLRKVIELLEQAVALDPRFGRAYGLASMAQAMTYYDQQCDAEALERADHAARQALQLDPSDAMALTTLASTHSMRLQLFEAEAYFQQSLRMNESEMITHRARFEMYSFVGYTQLAVRHAKRAYELAPGFKFNVLSLALALSALGSDAEVRRYADLAVSLGVPREYEPLCRLYWHLARRAGDLGKAVACLASLVPEMHRPDGVQLLERIHSGLTTAAHREDACAALRELDGPAHRRSAGIDPLIRPKIIYATLLGDLDLAFYMMERDLTALQRNRAFYHHILLLWEPDLCALRQDGRFQGVFERLGLPRYWRIYGAPDGCELQGNGLLVR